MTLPAAGWYPDPAGSPGQRYWTGTGWTDKVTTVPPPPVESDEPPASDEAAVDPLAAPPQLPPRQVPTRQPPQGTQMPGLPPAPPEPGYHVIPDQSGARGPAAVGFDGQPLSGWWRRVAGFMLDQVVIGVATLIVLGIVGATTGAFSDIINATAWDSLLSKVEADPSYQPTNDEILNLVGDDFITLIVWSTIVNLFFSALNGIALVVRSGQTIGDRAVRNRKVMAGRRVPTASSASVRWLLPQGLALIQFVPVVGLLAWPLLLVNYLWPLWDPRNQTWQDKAGRTVVERADLSGPPAA